MFCPQCKAEYRLGFTRCADCDVDLVESLAEAAPSSQEVRWPGQELSEESLEQVWNGEDQQECVRICRGLQRANIPYKVVEQNQQSLWNRDQRFIIGVLQLDSQAAMKIANAGQLDFTEEDEEQGTFALPARDDLPVEDVHGDWKPKDWCPDDATLEIWSGNLKDWGSIMEMSLKENRINYRVDLESDLKRVFVMPEDEARAREIVREIVEGAPPG